MTSPARILIVDDHADLRLLARATLEEGNRVFQEATNGREALDILEDFRPTVVILDVMLPDGIDGYEVCRRIKATDQENQAFVIMLTARAQKADEQMGKAVGADLYLIKPFSPSQLDTAVRNFIAGQPPDNS